MKLKFISLKNWQEIKKLEIYFENLMTFIGQSNEGISSVFSALLFAFDNEKFKQKFNLNENITSRIKLNFFDEKNKYSLKIIVNKKISYFLKINTEEWREINYDVYLNFISKIPFIYINDVLKKDFGKINKFFYNLMKNEFQNNLAIKNHLENYSKSLGFYKNSQELSRYLFFEFIKKLSEECLKKSDTMFENAIVLFEDPELFLPPQKEKELYNYLVKLSNRGISVYLKTYSSSFIGLKQYKSICIIKKVDNKLSVYQPNKKIFKGDAIKSFNMNYWVNPDRAELFFAKKVILVEGQTDKIVISALGKMLGIFKYDYSIIECGSKSIIPQFIALLNIFRLPYIAVYDKDNHSWRSTEEIENSNIKNRSINAKINKNFGEAIIFDNDIEEEIYNKKNDRAGYKNKPFNALQFISRKDFQLPKSLELKIKKIYE